MPRKPQVIVADEGDVFSARARRPSLFGSVWLPVFFGKLNQSSAGRSVQHNFLRASVQPSPITRTSKPVKSWLSTLRSAQRSSALRL